MLGLPGIFAGLADNCDVRQHKVGNPSGRMAVLCAKEKWPLPRNFYMLCNKRSNVASSLLCFARNGLWARPREGEKGVCGLDTSSVAGWWKYAGVIAFGPPNCPQKPRSPSLTLCGIRRECVLRCPGIPLNSANTISRTQDRVLT